MTLATVHQQPPPPEKIQRNRPAHLLIVDDETEIADVLADYLRRIQGFYITLVNDGQKAIDALKASLDDSLPEIDLVLLDMRMPNVSGLDVLNWIRSHSTLRYTRVVLVTAAAGSHEKVEALTAGADDYITKPFRPPELLARVNTILRTQQLEKLLQRQSQQLAALNQIGQSVAKTFEMNEVVTTAVSGINQLLGIEAAAILILEGGQLRFKQVWHETLIDDVRQLPPIDVGQGILGTVLVEKQNVLLNQVTDHPHYLPQKDLPVPLTLSSMIAAPLVVRDRVVGVMSAYNKQAGYFSEVDLDLFASLASSVSEAIANTWLFQRVRLRQQELLENRNTLQALIDGIPHPIYTINNKWQLVTMNQSKANELETTTDALVGTVCYRTFFDREAPCEHCHVALTLESRQTQTWTVSWKGADLLPREWDVSAYPIPSKQSGAARAVILWQDRTEERRLESSFLQAGKLAAIGQLAAGVAHEINNPLTAVNANAEMLKMVISRDDENYEAVDLIAQAGERATKVVRGLLDFARQEHYRFVLGDINASIGQALDLVRYQLNQSSVKVELHLDADLPPITASWEHLKSVWLNLLVNATDAIDQREGSREITVTTRLAPENNHIQALFSDNGVGMTKAQIAHIFEPFYTTKDPGKGTGLGLATSHRIIEQHGGEINVVSTVNEGTTFIIRLPVDQTTK